MQVMGNFDRSELERRAQRAREMMDSQGLDALLVTGDFSAGMNYYYLSGHQPRDYQLNYSRPHVMVLPREREPFLWVYEVNEQNARHTSWVEDVAAYGPPFSGTALAQAMNDRGMGSGIIGAELGMDQRLAMPLSEWQALLDGIDAEVRDATDIVWSLRAIKSDAETQYIRRAGEINHRALEAGFAALHPGDSEVDVARAVGSALVEAGAYRPPYGQILIVSEAKSRELGQSSRMLGPLEQYTLNPGDLLFVDSGAILEGYWGEFNRMAVVGSPTAEQRRHHDNIRTVVRRSLDEGLRPGQSFRKVIELMASFYRDAGYPEETFAHYLGPPFMHLCHGVGLAGSEPPFVRYDSEQVLEPGMVLSCEAYLRADGMTYGSEEDVRITENGCELLSSPDPGLFVIGE